MLTLALVTLLAAPPSARLMYEQKCLYCHSEEVTEQRKLPERTWARLIERMREKAPLLITRSDVEVLTRYVTRTLKLVPAKRVAPPRVVAGPQATTTVTASPPVLVPPTPSVAAPPSVSAPPPSPEPEPDLDFDPPGAVAVVAEEDRALEERGFALMERRCSRCHTLGRVYTKLDNLERALGVIARMRLKTGSGITERDQRQLEEFVRAQLQER